jgi:hypothetical protein
LTNFILLTCCCQDRGAALRRAVKQTGMMRIYPDGMARLGGYGIPAAFSRQPAESYDAFVLRCTEAFRTTAIAAMDGLFSVEALVNKVRELGTGVLAASPLFILVPALAPLNGKMGGAAGSPSEATWTTMLTHPLLLLTAPLAGTAFSTATTSLRAEAARVQQAVRLVDRKSTFCVAAASAGLPFADWPGGPEALLTDVRCPACRAQRAAAGGPQVVTLGALSQAVAACPGCTARFQLLQGFLDAGPRCVVAAREHGKVKGKALLTWCGAEGKARAQRLRDAQGFAWDEDGMEDACALDRVVLTQAGVKRQLGVWGSWVCRVAEQLHGTKLDVDPTTFKIFEAFRVWRLAPWVDWDVGAATGAKTEKSMAKQRIKVAVVNKMVDVFDRGCKGMIDFVKRVMGTQGETIGW